jgi:hypothetical protein
LTRRPCTARGVGTHHHDWGAVQRLNAEDSVASKEVQYEEQASAKRCLKPSDDVSNPQQVRFSSLLLDAGLAALHLWDISTFSVQVRSAARLCAQCCATGDV